MRSILWWLMGVLALACFALPVQAAPDAPGAREFPPGLQIPEAARTGPDFDVDRATQAYLDLLTPEQRALSDAYFEGGYWLQLWGFLYGLGVCALLLLSGLSRWMRDLSERLLRRTYLQNALYVALWLVAGFVLALPLSIYADFYREHQYGLATQDFGGWFGDQLKGLAIGLVVMPWLVALLYRAIRRVGARWWLWGSGGALVFFVISAMLAPVYLAPLFNDYKPLRDGAVRDAVFSLARANQIPTDNVVEFDASRQTTRISANVSGFAGTTRVALNDNLLDKTSLPEIKAVMGHEMGHYVLNHSMRLIIYLTLVIGFALWFTQRGFDALLARWGARLGLRDRADTAALPLAWAVLTLFFFLATPVTNSITRQAEAEADMFGLDAAREPYGFAMAAMRLSTYRKIHPGPLEEIVFYDHPSGYARVRGSMIWLKENQALLQRESTAPTP